MNNSKKVNFLILNFLKCEAEGLGERDVLILFEKEWR
jgi:hypothetical protein